MKVDQLDITAPAIPVQVEIDSKRKVLYVHVDGHTALRICRMPDIEVVIDGISIFTNEPR